MTRARLVAEVSSNHGSDLPRALAFVDAAAQLGFGAVKFQQFKIAKLFAPEALRAHPELGERVRWELPEAFNAPLAERAHAHGIAYTSTPFYLDAVGVLEPHVDAFKIASYQVLWHDLLREVAATGKPIVLATGLATLAEVRDAVEALERAGARDLTLLHCVSAYPTPPEHANLRAIETLRAAFRLPVGWSDHTVSPDVAARAVRRFDATMIELHLDLDGRGDEFAGGHCWLPADVRRLVARLASYAPEPADLPCDGDGDKAPRGIELDEVAWRSDPADGLRPVRAKRAELGAGRRRATTE
jgi:N-acetylneuraminate synthase